MADAPANAPNNAPDGETGRPFNQSTASQQAKGGAYKHNNRADCHEDIATGAELDIGGQSGNRLLAGALLGLGRAHGSHALGLTACRFRRLTLALCVRGALGVGCRQLLFQGRDQSLAVGAKSIGPQPIPLQCGELMRRGGSVTVARTWPWAIASGPLGVRRSAPW